MEALQASLAICHTSKYLSDTFDPIKLGWYDQNFSLNLDLSDLLSSDLPNWTSQKEGTEEVRVNLAGTI
jgi:hypothetical protein